VRIWQHVTPCQLRQGLFLPRRGGEDHAEFVARAGEAREICDTLCDRADDCREYAIAEQVTGICAGALYDEGKVVEIWPPLHNGGKRKSACCTMCETVYDTQTANPLCIKCRSNRLALAGKGGGANGESPSSEIGYRAGSEAA